ncbi:MAG: ChbG/HpnK family deacetylase [Candidatus Sumerlaeaceae bacterium]|nr:ChbG/HpnK family deacetylase [Candidatus Sumerlaeaceae bacterium]
MTRHLPFPNRPRLIIRLDDAGFCHAANMAVERVLDAGMATAVSVMAVTPWLHEAAEILARHPEVSVGLHTCLNCEWTPYRWGPVLPPRDVPSLVDARGCFFGTRAELMAHGCDPDEAEAELRAQLDRLLNHGLRISYLDTHMGTAASTLELRMRLERIARDHDLCLSQSLGEMPGPDVYSIAPGRKTDALLDALTALASPGLYLSVFHVGTDTPEMAVLRDLNPHGLTAMARHRQAEADALCDPRVKAAIKALDIELVGYDVLRREARDTRAPSD